MIIFCAEALTRVTSKDFKVIMGESVTKQHRPLVCTLISNKGTERKPPRVPRTKL